MIGFKKSVFAIASVAALAFSVGAVEAKTCFKKAGTGEAGSEADAKFQVDEVLLQATDWGAWASWMSTGKTPGYTFGPRKYRCSKGGSWGWKCYGQATICKL
jgi:hypothetical protein